MILGINIYKDKSLPISVNLTEDIRNKIISGELTRGEKLPSTRTLAVELGISRNTVLNAYEQLLAEGYLETRHGSGTYVNSLSELYTITDKNDATKQSQIKFNNKNNNIIFDSGNPDNTLFPATAWASILKKVCLSASSRDFSNSEISGDVGLKTSLCQYLYRSKGIRCMPHNIFIVPGTAGGLSLISDIFERNNRRIAIEDPCIEFVKKIFSSRGYEIYHIPVDTQGMISSVLKECAQKPALIYTVPSHQFPTGVVLSATRRFEILNYARQVGAYIIEDDYDSELNYSTRPIHSLYSLDPDRTIYVGSFSKIFSTAIRLGYMIIPDNLYYKIEQISEQLNIRTEILTQKAMSEYISDKMLDKHIYKMKKVYSLKRKYLISCINKYLANKAEILGENVGLHVIAAFNKDLPSSSALCNYGINAEAAEYYAFDKSAYKNKLILGYGNLNLDQIEQGVERLAIALDKI